MKTARESSPEFDPLTTYGDLLRRFDARAVLSCRLAPGDRVVHKDEPSDVGAVLRIFCWHDGEIFARVRFRKGGTWGGPVSVLRPVKAARKKIRSRRR